MSDPSQSQPSSSGPPDNAGRQSNGTPQPRVPANPTGGSTPSRPLRGMPALRGVPSLRGAAGGRGASHSNASMVPSRSSYATPSSSSAGTAAPGVRMQFRPVMPQRRKPSESPAPAPSSQAEASRPSPLSGPPSGRGGMSSRGRGGARPPRQPVQMTASGPFALGPSSRPTTKSRAVPLGPGGSNLTPASQPSDRAATPTKQDPERASYRNPDKLKHAEQYSDPEDGGVEIIDMDEVYALDDLAPRALPRVAEKKSKKEKQKDASDRAKRMQNRIKAEASTIDGIRVKTEEDEDQADANVAMEDSKVRATTVSSTSTSPQPESRDGVNTADALDLSESEAEELMDDLVDDFVFNDDLDGVTPENRLYLFQFPQLFPKFVAAKGSAKKSVSSAQPSATASATAAASNPASDAATKRRSVSFAEGTAGGAGSAGTVGMKKDETDVEDDEDEEDQDADSDPFDNDDDDDKKDVKKRTSESKAEGQIGKLDVYRDGRVFMRFGDLVMEVTGGSQSTFLQQVMLLDAENRTATTLGELHRKFIVSPELDCMLNDVSIYDREQRVEAERIKREQVEKDEADRIKYGARGPSFTSVGGR